MGFRHWITRNATKTAEAVVEKTKEAFQEKAISRVTANGHIYTTIGKLVSMGTLILLAFREARGYSEPRTPAAERNSTPNTITINNYIREPGKERDE